MGTRESPYPQLGHDGNVKPASNNYGNYAPQQPMQSHQGGGYNGNYGQQQPQGYEQPAGYYQPPPQQQQYAPPPQQYNDGKNNAYGGGYADNNYGMGEKFAPAKPKWNDLIFLLLFWAQFLGFVALSVISLRAIGASADGGTFGGSGGTSITLNLDTAYLLMAVSGAAFVLTTGYLLLVRAFTKIILEITLFLSVALTVAYAVYLWYIKYWSGAIIFTIMAIISVIAYAGMRRFIPFSTQVLLYVLRVAKKYPSTYAIAFFGTLLQAIYSIYWSASAVAIYQRFTPQAEGSGASSSSGAVIGLMVYAVFSFYWTSQVILNTTLVVEAGIFGTDYFAPSKESGGAAPRKVAWGAWKRAMTYSQGSICFGSLIVALLDTLKAILHAMRSYQSGQGDMIGAALACCAECCVGIIAWAVEFFNRYAYIEIALYGKPYIQAAKDTWRLMKDRGITALVNDCLINNIWTFGSIAVGALCSAFVFLYLKISNPSYIQQSSGLKAAAMGYGFIIGFFICHTLGYGCLSAGASTLFVALAEDPMMLAEKDPALFETIRKTYPQVVTPV